MRPHSQVVLVVKYLPANAGNAGDAGLMPGLGRSPGGGHGNSSILSWKIPWTEGPGRLQSMGLQRVGHDLAHILQVRKLRGCFKNAFLVDSVNIPSLDCVKTVETPSSPPFATLKIF